MSRWWPRILKLLRLSKTAATLGSDGTATCALFCREREIRYQGFSLLTANVEVLHHPLVVDLAARANATPAQVVFSFARAVGILPLTGTSNAEHMKHDLDSRNLVLAPEAVRAIESLDRNL